MDLINAAIATALAELLTLPICTVKTNYQNSASTIRSTVARLYAQGWPSFFQASGPAISAQVISTSSKYFLYRRLEQNNPDHVWWLRTLNGSASGLISSLVTHPLDTIKVHWQMGKPMPELLLSNYYRGYSKTLGKIGVGSAIFFPVYDHLLGQGLSTFQASLCTAVIGTTVVQPLDYAKTRQIYGLQHLDKNAVIKSYFRGVSLNYARVVPHFVIVMSVIKALQ
jgi:hypothetical protein